jgi:predicted RNA-binding Zn ribbon-like protein
MLDACYSPSAVQTAVDLANTLKPIKGEDALETVEQLRDFLDDHSPVGPAEPPSSAADQGTGLRRGLTRADLAEVHALRETVRAVLERASTDAAGAAALVNGGLRRSRATPALRHDHDRWWTEVTSDTDRCSAHLAATTLSALASVIATLGPTRLGVCAGPSCRSTFVDLSRNGSKQYCTRTCAHRASVAAYRSRRSPR